MMVCTCGHLEGNHLNRPPHNTVVTDRNGDRIRGDVCMISVQSPSDRVWSEPDEDGDRFDTDSRRAGNQVWSSLMTLKPPEGYELCSCRGFMLEPHPRTLAFLGGDESSITASIERELSACQNCHHPDLMHGPVSGNCFDPECDCLQNSPYGSTPEEQAKLLNVSERAGTCGCGHQKVDHDDMGCNIEARDYWSVFRQLALCACRAFHAPNPITLSDGREVR